jgi:hypothetical protein
MIRRGHLPKESVGLTLVEMICVTGIAAIMMGALLGTVTITARGSNEVRSVMRLQRLTSGVERVLREDLALVCALRAADVQTFVGRPLLEYSYGPVMEFFTLNSLADGAGGAARRVAYSLKAVEGEGEAPETYELYREETPWRTGEATEVPAERLASGIRLFSAEYYDGVYWRDQWQLTSLPDMVRITLTVSGEGGRTIEESFTFTPYVRSSEDPSPRL